LESMSRIGEPHMKTVRIGILGAANIVPAALIKPAKPLAEVTVTAIAARDITRAQAFAKKHQIPRVFASYDELLNDPAIDAVYIPLPNSLHGRWTIRALEAGKHVLCEKPMAATYADAKAMCEAAEKSGYAIGQVEKTFTVSGIDEYIRSYDMLDRETQAKMERHARDIIDATFATPRGLVDELYPGQWIFIWDEIGFMNSLDVREINLIHTYFLTLKKGLQRGYRESMNATFFVYEVKFTTNRTNKDGIDVVYLPVYYTDIIKRDSGALDVILTNAGISNKKSSTLENVYRDIVTANKAKYDCEEIE